MKKFLIKSLSFLRVIDSNKQLSITNIAVIAVLIKLILAPALSITAAGTLLVTLISYSHKRHTLSKQTPESPVVQLEEEVKQMKSKLTALELKQGIERLL